VKSKNCVLFLHSVSKKDVPLSRANLRIWAKKVLDSRFPILVTRCDKRSKKIFKLAVLGARVAALLIEKRIGDRKKIKN
jgi:hypothetical protein